MLEIMGRLDIQYTTTYVYVEETQSSVGLIFPSPTPVLLYFFMMVQYFARVLFTALLHYGCAGLSSDKMIGAHFLYK